MCCSHSTYNKRQRKQEAKAALSKSNKGVLENRNIDLYILPFPPSIGLGRGNVLLRLYHTEKALYRCLDTKPCSLDGGHVIVRRIGNLVLKRSLRCG